VKGDGPLRGTNKMKKNTNTLPAGGGKGEGFTKKRVQKRGGRVTGWVVKQKRSKRAEFSVVCLAPLYEKKRRGRISEIAIMGGVRPRGDYWGGGDRKRDVEKKRKRKFTDLNRGQTPNPEKKQKKEGGRFVGPRVFSRGKSPFGGGEKKSTK